MKDRYILNDKLLAEEKKGCTSPKYFAFFNDTSIVHEIFVSNCFLKDKSCKIRGYIP